MAAMQYASDVRSMYEATIRGLWLCVRGLGGRVKFHIKLQAFTVTPHHVGGTG